MKMKFYYLQQIRLLFAKLKMFLNMLSSNNKKKKNSLEKSLIFHLFLICGVLSLLILKLPVEIELSSNNISILKFITFIYFIIVLYLNILFIKKNLNLIKNKIAWIKRMSIIMSCFKLISCVLLYQFILLQVFQDFNFIRSLILNLYLLIFMLIFVLIFLYNEEKKSLNILVETQFKYLSIISFLILYIKVLFQVFFYLWESFACLHLDTGAKVRVRKITRTPKVNTDSVSIDSVFDPYSGPTSFKKIQTLNESLDDAIMYHLNCEKVHLRENKIILDNFLRPDPNTFLNETLLLEYKLDKFKDPQLLALSYNEKLRLVKLQLRTIGFDSPVAPSNFPRLYHLMNSHNIEDLVFVNDILYGIDSPFFDYSIIRAIYLNTLNELVEGYLEVFLSQQSNNININTLISLRNLIHKSQNQHDFLADPLYSRLVSTIDKYSS